MKTQVIVDTSVWIDFFKGKFSASQKEGFGLLLEAGEVVVTDIIKHELLIGAPNQKAFNFLSETLSALDEISLQPNLKNKFNKFGYDLKFKGFLGKYTDLSIAFLAQEYSLPVLSFDKYFNKLAEKKIIKQFKL